jgi:serine/threonine protein kinase
MPRATSRLVTTFSVTIAFVPNCFYVGKALGKGTFGQVKQGTHVLTGEKVSPMKLIFACQVAVKILEKEKINDQKDVERITREIKILKKVRHPNVIQLYEVSLGSSDFRPLDY